MAAVRTPRSVERVIVVEENAGGGEEESFKASVRGPALHYDLVSTRRRLTFARRDSTFAGRVGA
jgi:hypothetical protein